MSSPSPQTQRMLCTPCRLVTLSAASLTSIGIGYWKGKEIVLLSTTHLIPFVAAHLLPIALSVVGVSLVIFGIYCCQRRPRTKQLEKNEEVGEPKPINIQAKCIHRLEESTKTLKIGMLTKSYKEHEQFQKEFDAILAEIRALEKELKEKFGKEFSDLNASVNKECQEVVKAVHEHIAACKAAATLEEQILKTANTKELADQMLSMEALKLNVDSQAAKEVRQTLTDFSVKLMVGQVSMLTEKVNNTALNTLRELSTQIATAREISDICSKHHDETAKKLAEVIGYAEKHLKQCDELVLKLKEVPGTVISTQTYKTLYEALGKMIGALQMGTQAKRDGQARLKELSDAIIAAHQKALESIIDSGITDPGYEERHKAQIAQVSISDTLGFLSLEDLFKQTIRQAHDFLNDAEDVRRIIQEIPSKPTIDRDDKHILLLQTWEKYRKKFNGIALEDINRVFIPFLEKLRTIHLQFLQVSLANLNLGNLNLRAYARDGRISRRFKEVTDPFDIETATRTALNAEVAKVDVIYREFYEATTQLDRVAEKIKTSLAECAEDFKKTKINYEKLRKEALEAPALQQLNDRIRGISQAIFAQKVSSLNARMDLSGLEDQAKLQKQIDDSRKGLEDFGFDPEDGKPLSEALTKAQTYIENHKVASQLIVALEADINRLDDVRRFRVLGHQALLQVTERRKEATRKEIQRQLTALRASLSSEDLSEYERMPTLLKRIDDFERMVKEFAEEPLEGFMDLSRLSEAAKKHQTACEVVHKKVAAVAQDILTKPRLSVIDYKAACEVLNAQAAHLHSSSPLLGQVQKRITEWTDLEKYSALYREIEAKEKERPSNSRELEMMKNALREKCQKLSEFESKAVTDIGIREKMKKETEGIIDICQATIARETERIKKTEEHLIFIAEMEKYHASTLKGAPPTRAYKLLVLSKQAVDRLTPVQEELDKTGESVPTDLAAAIITGQKNLKELGEVALSRSEIDEANCKALIAKTRVWSLTAWSLWTYTESQAAEVNAIIGKQIACYLLGKSPVPNPKDIALMLKNMQEVYPALWELMLKDPEMTWLIDEFYNQYLFKDGETATLSVKDLVSGISALNDLTHIRDMSTICEGLNKRMKAVQDELGLFALVHVYSTISVRSYTHAIRSVPTARTNKKMLPILVQLYAVLKSSSESHILDLVNRKQMVTTKQTLEKALLVLKGSITTAVWHASSISDELAPDTRTLDPKNQRCLQKLCGEFIQTELAAITALKMPLQALTCKEDEMKIIAGSFSEQELSEIGFMLHELNRATQAGMLSLYQFLTTIDEELAKTFGSPDLLYEDLIKDLTSKKDRIVKKLISNPNRNGIVEAFYKYFTSDSMRLYASRLARFSDFIKSKALFTHDGKFDKFLEAPPSFLGSKLALIPGKVTVQSMTSQAFQRPMRWTLLMTTLASKDILDPIEPAKAKLLAVANYGAQSAQILHTLTEILDGLSGPTVVT